MKKLFLLLAIATLSLTSCSTDEVAPVSSSIEQPTENNLFVITGSNIETALLKVSKNNIVRTGGYAEKTRFEVQNGDIVRVWTDHDINIPLYIKVKIGNQPEQTITTEQGEAMNYTVTISGL